jgi:pre-mRNA-splicing factor 18
MDFLKAEIERKKRQIQEKNVMQPEKKYFKRGDLAAIQVQCQPRLYSNVFLQTEEYMSKYGPKKKEEEAEAAKPEEPAEEVEEEELTMPNLYPLPRVEVTRRLREMLHPMVFFGESDEAANRRLRALVLDGGDTAKMKHTSNDYQEAMKAVDKQYLKLVQVGGPVGLFVILLLFFRPVTRTRPRRKSWS